MKTLAWGGVVGPVVFVTGWLALGLTRSHYSMSSDPISELARVHTSTHAAMTIVFGVYALCLLGFAHATSNVVAAVNALATAAVAAFPLGAADTAHFASAAVAYVTLALLPLTIRRTAGEWSFTLLIAVLLTASVIAPHNVHGLFQRIGLTLGDAWIVWRSLQIMKVRSADYP